jgi:hypothetical protein
VLVENIEIAGMMTQIAPRIAAFMRTPLQHAGISITFHVPAQGQEVVKPRNKREQLLHFCDLNSSLISLGKSFKLELS